MRSQLSGSEGPDSSVTVAIALRETWMDPVKADLGDGPAQVGSPPAPRAQGGREADIERHDTVEIVRRVQDVLKAQPPITPVPPNNRNGGVRIVARSAIN